MHGATGASFEPSLDLETEPSQLFSLPHAFPSLPNAFPSLQEFEGPRVRQVDRKPSDSETTTEDVSAKLLADDSPRKARLLSSAFLRAKSDRLLLGSPRKYKQLDGSVTGLSAAAQSHLQDEANEVETVDKDCLASAGISWDTDDFTGATPASPQSHQRKTTSWPITTGGIRKSIIMMSPMRLVDKKLSVTSSQTEPPPDLPLVPSAPVSPRSNSRTTLSPRNSPRNSPRARIELSRSVPGESPRRGALKTLSIPADLAFSDDSNEPIESKEFVGEESLPDVFIAGSGDVGGDCKLNQQRRHSMTKAASVRGDWSGREQSKARRNAAWKKHASQRVLTEDSMPELEQLQASDVSDGSPEGNGGSSGSDRQSPRKMMRDASCRRMVKAASVRHVVGSSSSHTAVAAVPSKDGRSSHLRKAGSVRHMSHESSGRHSHSAHWRKSVDLNDSVGHLDSAVDTESKRSIHMRKSGSGRELASDSGPVHTDEQRNTTSTHVRKSGSGRKLASETEGSEPIKKSKSRRNVVADSERTEGSEPIKKSKSRRNVVAESEHTEGTEPMKKSKSRRNVVAESEHTEGTEPMKKSKSRRNVVTENEPTEGTEPMKKSKSRRNVAVEGNGDVPVPRNCPEKASRRASVGTGHQTPRRMVKAASVRNIQCAPPTTEKPLSKSLTNVDVWNSVPTGVPAPLPSDERRRLVRDPNNKSMRARGVLLGTGASERHLQVDEDEMAKCKHRAGQSTGSHSPRSPRSPRRKVKTMDASAKASLSMNSSSTRLDRTVTQHDQDRAMACRVLSAPGEADAALELIKSVELTTSPRQQHRQKMIVPSKQALLQAVASMAPDLLVEPEKPKLGRKLMDGLLGRSSINAATRSTLKA